MVGRRSNSLSKWTMAWVVVSAFLFLSIPSSFAVIKIGAVTCLTGALSTFGVSSVQGAKLAVEEINAAGGKLGQSIQLIVEDNGSKAGETSTITRKFISQDKVVAILGDLTSSATLEGAPLAQAAKIPLLDPLSYERGDHADRKLHFSKLFYRFVFRKNHGQVRFGSA